MAQARRVNLAVATGVALFATAVIVAAASLIFQDKRLALASSNREIIRVAGSAEASLNRSLLGVDLLLAETGNLMVLASSSDDVLDETRATLLLRGVSTANLAVRHITLLDAQGSVVASSDANAKRLGLALPDRFLGDVLAQAAPALSVSAPSMSFVRSERVLYVARPISIGKSTRLAAVAEVGISALTDTIARGGGNGRFEISLERANGQLLASVPPREDLLGTVLTPALVVGQNGDGELKEQPGRISGSAAIVVARPTLYPGIFVAASLPMDTALADWRNNRLYVLGGAAAFVVMILTVGVLSRSYLLRIGRAREEIAQSKATVDQALDSMIGGFLLLDRDGRVVTWNQRYLDMHPWLIGIIQQKMFYRQCLELTAAELFPEVDQGTRDDWVAQRTVPLRAAQAEHEQRFPGGRVIRVSERRTPDGGYVSMFWDISERKRQEAAVLAGKAQLQATIDAIPDLLYEVSLDGRYRSYHSARTERSATPPEDVLGKRVQDLLPPDAASVVMAALAEAHVSGVSMGKQFELTQSGGKQWFELSVSRKPETPGEEALFIVISRDVTASRVAANEIEHLAFYDPLTGLPNRRLLMDRLRQALATNTRRANEGALLFIDLDHFKTLNDTLGHEMGDKLLLQVARRLTTSVRKGDTVARLGGDEFVVIFEDIGSRAEQSGRNAGHLSEKVLEILSQPYVLESHEYLSTVSIGVTLFNSAGNSPDDLVKQADIAMYQAKAAGRNAIRFYDPQMQLAINERVLLEKDMRAASLQKQFTLYYQKQVAQDGSTVGAEALIRWPHHTRGLVMPGEFIPMAEETGLIVQIGIWVLETACTQLKRWESNAATRDLQLSINVSAHQFRQPNFVDLVTGTLQRIGVQPNRLTLELTESVMLDSVYDSIEKVKALGDIGVRFSIDDFGTGHSSLSYLSKLPIAQLKIAQPFVESIGASASDAVIIHTIIGMAQNLGIEVIAEGVETEAQRTFLLEHGCSLCQGYLFGRPVPIEEFERSI